MSTMPAAAAAVDSPPLDLHARLQGFLARTCGDEARVPLERLLPASAGEADAGRRDAGFYWLRLPAWLAEDLGLSRTSAGRALVADLLWIQYCVWAVFRLQDDLVDGESDDALLAVQANHLLVEAARCAARHFPGDSPFWTVFQQAIDATARALVRLDRLQRQPRREPRRERELYADLAACLKIATAGVLLAAGRQAAWRRALSPALDRVAVAAQILDDLGDIGEDLRGGRVNYAAWYLSRPIFSPLPAAVEAVIASNLATGERLEELLAEVRTAVDEALALAAAICPRIETLLRRYRSALDGLAERFRRRRAETLAPPEAGLQPAAAASNATASFSQRSVTAEASRVNSRLSTCSALAGSTSTRSASLAAS